MKKLDLAADVCSGIMGYIESVSGDPFPYDNRIFGYDWDPIEAPVTGYFNADPAINPNGTTLWSAIHV